jgi:hypothetical protein
MVGWRVWSLVQQVGATDGNLDGFELGFDKGPGESVGTAVGEIKGWPEGAREEVLLGCTVGDHLVLQ